MFTEDQLLPISALQHLIFCERQTALIHLERLWSENRYTTEGRHLHDKAHDGPGETRSGIRIERGLPLVSHVLGLYGVADVIEFHPPASSANPSPKPYPIEYKRGRPKAHRADELQLCAQAVCLEEMLNLTSGHITEGALFYGKTRKRQSVPFDEPLRALVVSMTRQLHELIRSGITPSARFEKKCITCSLLHLCLPTRPNQPTSANRAFAASLNGSLNTTPKSD